MGKLPAKDSKAVERRKRAHERLAQQLKKGKKWSKELNAEIPLEEKDVKRIEKEMEIILTRV